MQNFDRMLKPDNWTLELSWHVCILQGPPRTSSLLAPIMLLTGHEGEIYTAKFSPDGQYVASAGFDRIIRKYCLDESGFFIHIFVTWYYW